MQANGITVTNITSNLGSALQSMNNLFGQSQAWNGVSSRNPLTSLEPHAQEKANHDSVITDISPIQSRNLSNTKTASLDASRSETFDLEIKTREGDIVKISYSSNQAGGFQSSQTSNQTSDQNSLSAYASESHNLSYSVQGNLSDDEKKAIGDAMKSIEKLANVFYGGDLQGAMQHALALNMNKEQLSSLSLDLTYSETITAISTYQQVGAIDQSNHNIAPLNRSETGAIGNFNQSLKGMLQELEKLFQESEKIAKQMLNAAPEAGQDKTSMQNMLEGLVAVASSRNQAGSTETVLPQSRTAEKPDLILRTKSDPA